MHANKLTKHYWVWPIAWYLFLGGLGGGILFVAGVLEVVYHVGHVLALGTFVGVALLGIGSFLLIFELGQPKVFLRVFLSGTAIIKYGATMLVLAMLFGFVFFLFYLPPNWNLFYYGWTWMRDLSAVAMLVLGLGIMVYTGVLLSTMKSKPFWNTPLLPVLFTVSALSTATALLGVLAGQWPTAEYAEALAQKASQFIGSPYASLEQVEEVVHMLHLADSMLVLVEVVVLLIYVLGMRAAGNVTAKAVALEWVSGSKAVFFWVGMVCLGTLLPFFLYLAGGGAAAWAAPLLVLGGGLLLRFMVVYSDRRCAIPGEERYYRRLPQGDEKFFRPWKAPY
ncbi:MAG: polysulfide reductase NrfD [Coriobacteriales bacterium]|nr:polysulfide reductase NrfD [Coriobacteriales bacterium]